MSNSGTKKRWNRGYGNFIYQGEKYDPAAKQRVIAICEPTTRTREDWEEVFKNAALIAAAPELLEALEECLATLSHSGLEREHATRQRAFAAVAKAKGTIHD